MAKTDVTKSSNEGYLSYKKDGGAWIELGYVNDFSWQKNPNNRHVYEHGILDHTKKGNQELTGSVSQLYTNSVKSAMAVDNEKNMQLKLEIKDDWEDTVTETIVLDDVMTEDVNFSNGGRDGEMTAGFDFIFKDYTADAYKVTFDIDALGDPLEDVYVTFNNTILLTDENGKAEFTAVAVGADQAYKLEKSGYTTITDTVSVVDADVTEAVTMVAT